MCRLATVMSCLQCLFIGCTAVRSRGAKVVIFPLAGKGLGAERMIETDECLAWMGICGRDVMGEVGCG